MTKNADLVSRRFKSRTWKLAWKPTAKDCKGCGGSNGETTLHVLIHELEITACVDRFAEALEYAARAKIPNRPGRHFKRVAHPCRPKTIKWQKAQRKKPPNKTDPEQIPPDPTK